MVPTSAEESKGPGICQPLSLAGFFSSKLDIDPVEAETIRLMFRLYLDGDGNTGPLGVKETTKWLNSHGYRTRRGSTFGVGPVHKILTNTCYTTGLWAYGKRDSRNGGLNDPSTVVDIPIPVLIEPTIFDRVQAKLSNNNPRTTAPRIVNVRSVGGGDRVIPVLAAESIFLIF
jgi:site-specific DNA recombinase